MSRVFVTTDTHGCNKELQQVLSDAKFDYSRDRLIHLGDCTDRGPDSYGVIETLLSIKDLVAIRGNHDRYFLDFINGGYHAWEHGSHKTVLSYAQGQKLNYPEVYLKQKLTGVSTNFSPKHIPDSHKQFFKNQVNYYVDKDRRLFVHAGYDPMEPIEWQSEGTLTWNRKLVKRLSMEYCLCNGVCENYPDVNGFTRVFVGHTTTIMFQYKQDGTSLWKPGDEGFTEPMYMGQLVNLDTGGCFGNKISLIDITDDTKHVLYQA